jgi:transcriptional regulator with XRE-family HTH domain
MITNRIDLKDERERQGLTQLDLAARIGIEQSTLSRWENGEINPHPIMLRAWNEALGLSVEEKQA